jgi:hypothetical protein
VSASRDFVDAGGYAERDPADQIPLVIENPDPRQEIAGYSSVINP